MKNLLFLFTFFIACEVVFSQTKIQMTFNLFTPGLAADSAVYIAGNLEQLGYWHPDKIKMTDTGNGIRTKTIILNKPASIEYKFTLGSWSIEAANSKGLPLSNFVIKVSRDTVVSDTVLFWTNPDRIQRKTTVTGTLKYHRHFEGKNLLPRDIAVWLPPGYENDVKQSYPVLYMQDGQNAFDAATSGFGNEWRADESCDSLIHIGKIPPLIVVAIFNTSERSHEYEPGNKGMAYMDFMVNTLKPFIDSNYRTKSTPENTVICGSSSGGIFAFMLAWEHPQVFAKAICFSPALKIQDIDYVKVVKSASEHKNVFFYIYNGGVGLEARLKPGIDEMIAVLKEKGYQAGKDFEVIIDGDARHREQAWARHFPAALQACFNFGSIK